jgi:hypothetical protein
MDQSKFSQNVKRSPVLVRGPELAHPVTNKMTMQASTALLAITDIFTAPPDLPNIARAIANVNDCLDVAIAGMPEAKPLIAPLVQGLRLAVNVGEDFPHQPLGLAGRKLHFPAWNLISNDKTMLLVATKTFIGYELVYSYILQKRFGKPLAEKLTVLVNKPKHDEDDQKWIKTKILEGLKKARKVVSARLSGVSTKVMAFNSAVNVYLHAQLSPRQVVQKQAAGRRNELPKSDVKTIFKELRELVQQGDFVAAVRCTAFCLGLSIELTLRVPIKLTDPCDAIVYIDPLSGTHYCNLTDVLATLAKTGPPGSVPSGLEYFRPFPTFLAEFWRAAIAANPTASEIGEIDHQSKSRYSRRIEGTKIMAGIPVTEARLIASRGAVFMGEGVDRDTAAYAATALYLLDKSDFHYLLKKPQEIWRACNKVFGAIGWGRVVARPQHLVKAVGTKKAARKAALRKKIAALKHAAETTRPGNNYSLQALMVHHNAYVAYIAFMLMVFLGGRNRRLVSYRADVWRPASAFGVHRDKPASPNASAVAQAIPTSLSISLRYLYIHFRCLDNRLEKLGLPADSPTRKRIKDILDGKPVSLLCKFDKHNLPTELRLKDVIDPTDELSGDAARHFVPSALEEAGVNFYAVQAWLKHHSSGTSINSVTFRVPPVIWLSTVARALDVIALELGLTPLHGISKG